VARGFQLLVYGGDWRQPRPAAQNLGQTVKETQTATLHRDTARLCVPGACGLVRLAVDQLPGSLPEYLTLFSQGFVHAKSRKLKFLFYEIINLIQW